MADVRNAAETTTLNNGVKMPWFGLGVYKTQEGPEVENAVAAALEAGYRLIDTAALYGNEKGVGNAIRASGIRRKTFSSRRRCGTATRATTRRCARSKRA
jgi:Aldo/keto reductases, related to diketogulonate reductase